MPGRQGKTGKHRAHRSFGYRFGQLCGYLILLAVPVLLMAAGSGIVLLVRAAAGILRRPGLELVPVLRRGDRPGRGGRSQAILAVQRRRMSRLPGSHPRTDAVDPQDPDTAAEQILRRAEAGAIESGARDETRRKAARREQDIRDDQVLIVLHRLEAEVRRLKTAALWPRNGFLRLVIRDLETNPHAQFRVHKWGMWYWIVNFPLVTALFFLEPSVWLKWGLYITLIYSIYANFATDYGAMSAAMAAYDDRVPLPPIPGTPFSGGRGGQGGTGGAGGSGGASRDGSPGEPGAPGSAGEPGEESKPAS